MGKTSIRCTELSQVSQGLGNFRENLFAKISKNVVGLITDPRRRCSVSHYELAWRKWDSTKQIGPISGPLNSLLDFSTELLHSG